MYQKKLEDMNLLDDFLFFKMLNHPGFGEEFSRELLKTIFGKEFGRLSVVPQKVYYGTDIDKHGARLDVYLEENIDKTSLEDATIYDIEPETKVGKKSELPQRVRFYHSIIDSESMKVGSDYKNLKRVVVIMIMPFDPFGYNHMVYTIKNSCMEIPELSYEDGARSIFLYTRGEKGNVSQGLRELLEYIEDSRTENAKNESLKKIDNMVKQVKREKGAQLEYMKIFERERMLREEGEEIGREKERLNTEKERQRAEKAEALLRELLGDKYKSVISH